MKILLLSMLMACSAPGYSQQLRISVSVQGKNVVSTPGDDNDDKILQLQKSMIEGYLTAKVEHEEIAKDWKRTLIIYDDQDSEIARLSLMKENTYCFSLKHLLPAIQNGKQYFLFTTIFPEDPQKAMEVKIARQLVCKLSVN